MISILLPIADYYQCGRLAAVVEAAKFVGLQVRSHTQIGVLRGIFGVGQWVDHLLAHAILLDFSAGHDESGEGE